MYDHPQLITVTFGEQDDGGYAHQRVVEAFNDWMVASSWLTQVGADYGVQSATHLAKVHLPANALPNNFTDAQVLALLARYVDAGLLPGPGAVLLLGGEPMDGPRHIVWNFVSSSRERIRDAARAWREQRFPRVPGETEHIPLPPDLPLPVDYP